MQRKLLSDILSQNDNQRLAETWEATEAADDYRPLPAGEYEVQVITGEPFNSRTTGTPGYKLTFQVLDGENAGRRLWHELWLTDAAMPMTKRDLNKFGVASYDQLNQPLPQGIRCRVKIGLRREDDGTEYNRVRSFEVIAIDEPERDPFAPDDSDTGSAPSDGSDGQYSEI
jgi:hypothetical protein